ncbi:MAG: peptidoglycan-binding domain-containing protein, partial [Patescibacteria group bacterium]
MKRLAILIVALSLLSQNAYASVGCLTFKNILKIGSNDPDVAGEVSKLQEFLALLPDESIYPEAVITGSFGGATERAVKRFQERNGLVSSGTAATTGYGAVGVKTAEKIHEVSCAVISTPAQQAKPVAPVSVPTIKVPVVQNILIDAPVRYFVNLGFKNRLNARAIFDNSSVDSTPELFSWKSSDPGIVSVDDRGVIEALFVGNAYITAERGGKAWTINVAVQPPPVVVPIETIAPSAPRGPVLNNITIDQPVSYFIDEGEQVNIIARAHYSDGTIFSEPSGFSWNSSSPDVASVDSNGFVVAESPGVSQVSAMRGGKAWTISVIVRPIFTQLPPPFQPVEEEPSEPTLSTPTVAPIRTVSSVTIDGDVRTFLSIGRTRTLYPKALFSDGTFIVSSSQFDWSSSDMNVASVSDLGLVNAKAEGTAYVTASFGEKAWTVN